MASFCTKVRVVLPDSSPKGVEPTLHRKFQDLRGRRPSQHG
jgi:hypothetical protein